MKKQFLIISVVAIILILMLGTGIYFGVTKASAISYGSQCSVPSCPSGYSSVDKDCDPSDNECTNYCEKETDGECGSYGSYSRGKSFTYLNWDGSSNAGDSYDTDTYKTDDNYCYKFYGESKFTVSSWGTADSYRLFVMDAWDSETTCTTSSSKTLETSSHTYGRGDGTGFRVIAEVNDYGDSSCSRSDPLNDLEGKLDIYLYVSKANWEEGTTLKTTRSCEYDCDSDSECDSDGYVNSPYCSNDNVYQDYREYTCSNFQCISTTNPKLKTKCDYGCSSGACVIGECLDGDEKCIEKNYYSCDNFKWIDEGEIFGKCGVESPENYYRFENNDCIAISLLPSEKISSDYSTLSECEENIIEDIPEEQINYYRFIDNDCITISILPSEKTENDYLNLGDCENKIILEEGEIIIYKLEDDVCNLHTIKESEKTSSDYSSLSQCKINIIGEPTTEESREEIKIINYILGAIIVIFLILIIVVIIGRKK